MTQAIRYSEALTVQVQPLFRSLIDTARIMAQANRMGSPSPYGGATCGRL